MSALLIPGITLAEESVSIDGISVSDQGELVINYRADDIEPKHIKAIKLEVNGTVMHQWVRKGGDDDSSTTHRYRFNTPLSFKDEAGYPSGNYRLVVDYNKSPARLLPWQNETITSETQEFTPPREHLSTSHSQWSGGGSLPLDQKINELYSNIVTFVAGPLAILFLIYAGYLYITSAGNPEQIGMAKEMMVSTIVAIIILLLAGLILRTIGETPVPDGNLGDNEQQQEEQQLDPTEQDSENRLEVESESGSEDEPSSEEEESEPSLDA